MYVDIGVDSQSDDIRRAPRENLTNILQQQQQQHQQHQQQQQHRIQNSPPQPMTNVQYLSGGGANPVPTNIPPQYLQQPQRMAHVSGPTVYTAYREQFGLYYSLAPGIS